MRTMVTLLIYASVVSCGLGSALAYTPSGRWGHTMTYIPSPTNPRLIIQGGRSDPSGGYTYTSAPLLPETLVLPLSSGFSTGNDGVDSTPWELVEGTGVESGVAWQTTGYLQDEAGEGYLISFGGDGGVTLPVQTGKDSLGLYSLGTDYSFSSSLSTSSTTGLTKLELPASEQPMRRWYPSSISLDKHTWLITGGQKGDGSGLGFRDVYSITLSPPVSTPSTDDDWVSGVVFKQEGLLPTDLAGHKTLRAGDGSVWLVGGWVPSSGGFLPLSTAYVRAPGSMEWELRDLSSTTVIPGLRRGHSLVLVSPTKAILYGGSASFSAGDLGSGVLGDIWELDLGRGIWTLLSPARTGSGSGSGTGVGSTKRAAGDGPGERFEHAAVGVDGKVLIFGGRTSSGMADPDLYVYDVDSNQWVTEFPGISGSAADDVYGIATENDDGAGGDKTGAQQPGSQGSAAATEIVVTRTDDNGGIVLSTRTAQVGVQTTKVVVVTGTSTDLIVSTDRAGLTVTSTRLAAIRKTSTMVVLPTGINDNPSTTDKSKNTAIALGTVFGCFGLIGLALLAWIIRRRKQGKTMPSGFMLRPFGGRPAGASRRAYAISGGVEGLLNDHVWDGSEKVFTPIKRESDLAGRALRGYTASANPYSPGQPALLTNIMGKIRNVSGRGAPRFDILADEDRSEIWKAPQSVIAHERETSGRTSQTDHSQSVDSEEFRIHHPAIPSSSTADADHVEGVLTTPVGKQTSQARRRVSGKALPGTPLRDPFEDPIENYYDAGIIDYADGVSADHSSSSFTSRDSLRNSLGAAAIETATKLDLSSTQATLVPLKRNESLMSRLAGKGASLFGGGRASRTSYTEMDGFLDPTPPPGLDPIAEASSSRRPLVSGGAATPPEPYRNKSYTSIETSATATSDMLANYGNMQIIQRERTASSRQPSATLEEADLGDVFIAQTADIAPIRPRTPPRSGSPRPREAVTPRGPRAAPPRHPTHIDLTPRRTVRDLAESINRRDFAADTPAFPIPSPLQASTAAFAAASPTMHSPYRGLGGAQGPRRPTTMYEVASRGALQVANPE